MHLAVSRGRFQEWWLVVDLFPLAAGREKSLGRMNQSRESGVYP